MIGQFLILWTSKALPETWKHQSRPIANTIIQQSQKYGFDPVFLMSVIENESSFNPEALGSAGEIGLMQITPETGAWITELFEIPWKGKKTLKNPVSNIIIGSAYLAYLREEFDYRGQLYLAAYNMGSGNVRKHLNRNTQPQVYPSRVMQRYLRFYSELQNSLKSKPSGTWASVGKKPETYSSALQSRQQSWASKPKKHLTHSNQLRPL
ncbi:MAG: lytic transglycosylase domain-containing protein [Bdellovibrionia bacterium]